VAAFCGVEVAEGLDGAPPEGEIDNILMFECPNVRAEIECGARKNQANEGAAQVRELDVELLVIVVVVLVEVRCP
jgi:hypothetical protein